jgi:hypothetical protein
MKKLVTVALAIALAFSAGNAMAQDAGDAGMFADPATLATTAVPATFAPQFVYVVAFGLQGDLLAFEAGVSGLTEIGATILGATFAGPAPLNIGAGTNYIVGTGGCVTASGAVTLVAVNYLLFAPAPADTPVCLTGTTPSSFNGIPGYADCNDVIRTFGVATSGGADYPDGCLIFNPTGIGPVDNETVSFGDVKARF